MRNIVYRGIYVNLDISRDTASKGSNKVLRMVSIRPKKRMAITYINLSRRSTAHGVGNAHSSDTNVITFEKSSVSCCRTDRISSAKEHISGAPMLETLHWDSEPLFGNAKGTPIARQVLTQRGRWRANRLDPTFAYISETADIISRPLRNPAEPEESSLGWRRARRIAFLCFAEMGNVEAL